MEEFSHALIDNRTIVKVNGSYQLDKTMSQNQVPDTIQGIIAGRMDRLEDNIKTTLQVASVIGRRFLFKILRTLPGLSDGLKTDLLRLQSLELIYEKRVFPELEYIFKNVITQEVAYWGNYQITLHWKRNNESKKGLKYSRNWIQVRISQ